KNGIPTLRNSATRPLTQAVWFCAAATPTVSPNAPQTSAAPTARLWIGRAISVLRGCNTPGDTLPRAPGEPLNTTGAAPQRFPPRLPRSGRRPRLSRQSLGRLAEFHAPQPVSGQRQAPPRPTPSRRLGDQVISRARTGARHALRRRHSVR